MNTVMLQPDLSMNLIAPIASRTFRFPNVPSGRDTSWSL